MNTILTSVRGAAGGLFERPQGFCLIHARAPQQVDGHSPDLADEHADRKVMPHA